MRVKVQALLQRFVLLAKKKDQGKGSASCLKNLKTIRTKYMTHYFKTFRKQRTIICEKQAVNYVRTMLAPDQGTGNPG